MNLIRYNPSKTQDQANHEPKKQGFTLLEILIAMSILMFISFATYQATIETYKLRDILGQEGDFYNGIRLSTAIVQKDIALLYSPHLQKWFDTPPPPEELTDDLGRSFDFWSQAIQTNGLRPSRFIGTDSKMSFISLSHMRIYRDAPESEFAKITYDLKKDDQDSENKGTLVLVRTESPNAFNMNEHKDPMKKSYEILRGIRKINYTYLTRDGNTWKTSRSWDSDKEENKNKFPEIIEMKIEVLGPKRLTFEGDFKFRPEIPLNGLNPNI